jgi:D-alanine-D-alanine ligase-like ATP-grasp enzyme
MFRRLSNHLIRARIRYEQVRQLLALREKKQAADFHRLRIAFYDRFWREAAQNIGGEVEDFGYGFLRIWKNGKWTLVNLYNVSLDDHLSLQIAGNKPLMSRFLLENGCRVPRFVEYNLTALGSARDFLKKLKGPAVIKPASGTGGGRGVTTKIIDNGRLKKASFHAAKFGWPLLIEEEVPGDSYRLLYLSGKLIDAVRRDSPTVIGDGRRSIRELMRYETEERLREPYPGRALSPLSIDLECVFHLQRQGVTPRQTPAANQRIAVKSVVNQNSRCENHRILERVNPSLEQACSRLVTRLGFRLVGLDIMTSEIGIPLEESGGYINEVNTTPGLHHHVLVAETDKKTPIAELILDEIFASSARSVMAPPLAKVLPRE